MEFGFITVAVTAPVPAINTAQEQHRQEDVDNKHRSRITLRIRTFWTIRTGSVFNICMTDGRKLP